MYNSSTPICLLCIKDRVSEDNSQKLAYVTCGHTFHEKCLDEWMEVSDFCFICKDKIEKEEDSYRITNGPAILSTRKDMELKPDNPRFFTPPENKLQKILAQLITTTAQRKSALNSLFSVYEDLKDYFDGKGVGRADSPFY